MVASTLLLVACSGRGERPQAAADKPSASREPRVQIAYSLHLDNVVDDRAAELRHDLEKALLEAKLRASVSVSATAVGLLAVTPEDPAHKPAIAALVKATYSDIVEELTCGAAAGPTAICIQIAASYTVALEKAALRDAADTIRARLVAGGVARPTVVERAGQLVVEFPGDNEQSQPLRSLVARTGKLELKVVDHDSDFMRRVFARVGSTGKNGDPTDPRAIEQEIRSDIDQWRVDRNTSTDYYLVAHDRKALLSVEEGRQIGCVRGDDRSGQILCPISGRMVIDRYLSDLAKQDPSFRIPDDREIGYELVTPLPGVPDARPHWRTYYLERAVRLTGASIASAKGSVDPTTARPIVLIDLDRAGTRAFAELTAQSVGKKLATILDGRIASAPIITGKISGGRASITMGGTDHQRQLEDRDELVIVFKTGALPAPLREESATVVP